MLTLYLLLIWTTAASAAYLDLTYLINARTLFWEKEDQLVMTPNFRQREPFWVATNIFSIAEHGGTHIDAPYHFFKDGWNVGRIPLRRLFMVEGVLINKTDEVNTDPNYKLTVKDIEDWEEVNGPLPSGCVVLVQFGWSSKYPDRTSYLGIRNNNEKDKHFPSITREAAQWLVDTSKVYGIGTDTASADTTDDFFVHRTVLPNSIFLLENLNLGQLQDVPPKGFKLVILPIKTEEGTGGPVRVVLVTKDKEK